MATNRHAQIRYKVLDKCFSNSYKKYFIEDLIKACTAAVTEFDGSDMQISRRTIFNDMDYMRSEAGWSAPIEAYRDGKRAYYRYSEDGFSIDNKPLTDSEITQLKETISMVSRFRGLANYEWLDEFITNISDKFGVSGCDTSVVGYEQNPYLNGLTLLTDLFGYIINKQTLEIDYKPFSKEERSVTIHPYFLKQYNSRWYLLGLADYYKEIAIYPIDRIIDIRKSSVPYIENETINFEEYFDDVVGVSIPKNGRVEEVVLRFSPDRFQYVLSKPIHWSQRILDKENGMVSISVIPNKELEASILYFGSDVEVISPESFRVQIRKNIEKTLNNYFAVQDDCTK